MKDMKRSMLAVMVGACLLSMAAGPVLAQSATGAVAGRAQPGAQVTIVNPATGLTRSVTAGADGSYRLSQLPVGDYRIESGGRKIDVNVALGGTTTVNLADTDAGSLDTVQVRGSRVVNRVDVRSTESATNVTREDIARIPVDQSMGAVALLAPGVVAGNASFGGISFGGSSVAENAVFINGLNVTDFYTRQSFSSTPFAFLKEYQVKTGGYSVEFGRSTGGVINAVTRAGSNEFRGGIEYTLQPEWGREAAIDRYYTDGTVRQLGSRDRRSFSKANLWASGPIVKDRLFLFAMYEDRSNRQYYTNNVGNTLFKDKETGSGFWGVKLDWSISDKHRLDLLAFSDEAGTTTSAWAYNFADRVRGAAAGDSFSESGGLNWSATYTGYFTENFVAKLMYGVNNRTAATYSQLDQACSRITADSSYNTIYASMGRPVLGCHPTGNSIFNRDDKRTAARIDFEWTLGDHLLRFGVDREVMTTDQSTRYPGPTGLVYSAIAVRPGTEIWDGSGALVPAGVTQALRARRRESGGVFDTVANAFYLEDVWSITPNFLLTLGLRWDSFENKTAAGGSFIKIDNMLAPRIGFSWDMKGDGHAKLYGNAGRYYLPVTNNINVYFAGGLVDEYTYYQLNGWQSATNPVTGSTYMAPVIGAQIGPVDTRMNISTTDLRRSVDRDLKAVYQDEAILGYQAMINEAWSWGVNATYRRMDRALDDMRINHTPCGPTGTTLWPIANPGEPLTIWGDASIGCATPGWITIDTATGGYRKGGSGEVVGYSKPRRTYKAVEIQIDRAWDEKWSFNASYLWSKSEGNFEGPVNSDTGYADTGMVQHWDHPANNERYGVLFNDHTHQIKLRAAYALNRMWSFGASLVAQSGGPITAFGVTWPNDSTGGGSFTNEYGGGGTGWICTANCGNYATRVLNYTGRGAYGRLPWTWNLGANVTWTLPIEGIDLKAKLSVYNLTNDQEVINVHSRYEAAPGVTRPYFGQGTRWQSPRYTQLVVTWNF